MKTTRTMTAAQMAWALRRGQAWEDPGNAGRPGDTYWTRQGGWQWDAGAQRYELVF